MIYSFEFLDTVFQVNHFFTLKQHFLYIFSSKNLDKVVKNIISVTIRTFIKYLENLDTIDKIID